MQHFTRSLTREIEVGGERLAITLSKEGVSVRPVGGRKPPYHMSWGAWLCACVNHSGDPAPTVEQVRQAFETVKAGAAKPKENPAASTDSKPAPPVPYMPPASPSTASDPTHLTTLLSRVDHWLMEHRRRFHHALLPGATAAECDSLATLLGQPLPEELRSWLSWHNGQSADIPGAFEQNWVLMSAKDIAETKKELDGEAHEGWQRAWVPFLDDEKGNYLCLDIHSPGCPVRECWQGRAEHGVVSPSLAAWVEDFVIALERGAYVEDPERGALVRS
jgi:cell wall assembly regulator SMI1